MNSGQNGFAGENIIDNVYSEDEKAMLMVLSFSLFLIYLHLLC
jgi:hypothetical protein